MDEEYLVKPNWLFRYGLFKPSQLATKWQAHAEGWKAMGEWPRARWCQAQADYWSQSRLMMIYGPKPTMKPPPLRREAAPDE